MDKIKASRPDKNRTKSVQTGQKQRRSQFHSGRRLQLARDLKSKRLKDLAEQFGVTDETIGKWQYRGIPRKRLPAIAKYFEVEEQIFSDGFAITEDEFKKSFFHNHHAPSRADASEKSEDSALDLPLPYGNLEFPWEQVVSSSKDDGEYHFHIGCKCNEEGKYDQAIFNLNKAIGMDMLDPYVTCLAYYERGYALYKKGSLAKALEDYLTSLETKPDIHAIGPSGCRVSLDRPFQPLRFPWYSGNVALKRIEDFNQLEADLHKSAMIHYLRGREEIELEGYDAAVADLSKAIELEPGSVHIDEFYGARGYAFYQKNLYPNAIEDFTYVIEKGKTLNPAVLYFRALVYEKKNRLAEAQEDIKSCLETDPNHGLFLEKWRVLTEQQ